MIFHIELGSVIGSIEGQMTFFWRFLEKNHNKPQRTTTKPQELNHNELLQITVNHNETSTSKPQQWTTTNHSEPQWNLHN